MYKAVTTFQPVKENLNETFIMLYEVALTFEVWVPVILQFSSHEKVRNFAKFLLHCQRWRGFGLGTYLAGRNTAISGEMCQASLAKSLQILSVKTV